MFCFALFYLFAVYILSHVLEFREFLKLSLSLWTRVYVDSEPPSKALKEICKERCTNVHLFFFSHNIPNTIMEDLNLQIQCIVSFSGSIKQNCHLRQNLQ